MAPMRPATVWRISKTLSLHTVGHIMTRICVTLWEIFRQFPLILLEVQRNRACHTVEAATD